MNADWYTYADLGETGGASVMVVVPDDDSRAAAFRAAAVVSDVVPEEWSIYIDDSPERAFGCWIVVAIPDVVQTVEESRAEYAEWVASIRAALSEAPP